MGFSALNTSGLSVCQSWDMNYTFISKMDPKQETRTRRHVVHERFSKWPTVEPILFVDTDVQLSRFTQTCEPALSERPVWSSREFSNLPLLSTGTLLRSARSGKWWYDHSAWKLLAITRPVLFSRVPRLLKSFIRRWIVIHPEGLSCMEIESSFKPLLRTLLECIRLHIELFFEQSKRK